MARRNRIPLPMYAARIERHTVAKRWLIAAEQLRLTAASELDAREYANTLAHGRLGVPPWRPCRRESLGYVTATRIESPTPAAIYPRSHQQDRIAA